MSLTNIRRQLTGLRRRRQVARWVTGYSGLASAVLWILVLLFVVDWSFALTRSQRVVAISIALLGGLWAFRRLVWPHLGKRETELDMALLVERRKGIDSDLVAALQFESSEARHWGSTQLEAAVIDHVANFSRGFDVYEGFSAASAVRRGVVFGVTLLVLVAAATLYPGHARSFFNRLALGSAHYPSRTRIESVLINGKPIDLGPEVPVAAKSPFGQPVKIVVVAEGELPPMGAAEFMSLEADRRKDIALLPTESAGHISPFVEKYTGELPQLLGDVDVHFQLGDAYTDRARIQAIPLPVVEIEPTVIPPSYALRSAVPPQDTDAKQQLAVLEGSRVELRVFCSNKRLVSAVLLIDNQEYPLAAEKNDPRRWVLSGHDSPLARVTAPVKYRLQVTDEDGLNLPQPLEGFVRIRPDRKPAIAADLVAQHWLPSGTPEIDFRASDDFGLARLVLHVEIAGSGEAREPATVTLREWKTETGLVARDEGIYPLSLSPFKLTKGDQVRLVLEAIDYRGDDEGQSTTSEPLVLNITDESGILAATAELDERSARQLDAILKLETGGTR